MQLLVQDTSSLFPVKEDSMLFSQPAVDSPAETIVVGCYANYICVSSVSVCARVCLYAPDMCIYIDNNHIVKVIFFI